MTYEARLKAPKLWSLEERRNRADLIEVYKLMHGFTDIPVSTYFQIATDCCTCGAFAGTPRSSFRVIDCAFSHYVWSTTGHWNSLSQEIVDAPSVNAFKRHWNHCNRRRWVTSWTFSPHKPFWLLVMQDTIVICLCFMMIAIGAVTPGELPSETSVRWCILENTILNLNIQWQIQSWKQYMKRRIWECPFLKI